MRDTFFFAMAGGLPAGRRDGFHGYDLRVGDVQLSRSVPVVAVRDFVRFVSAFYSFLGAA